MRPRFSIQSWMAPAFAVAIAMTFNVLVRTAEAAGTKTGGTVTGQVTDKDGKPVANAKVRVTAQNSSKKSGATTKPAGSDDAASTASRSPTTQGSASGGGKTPAVAEGTTDADGKFSIADVPAGDYNVSASVKGQGAGREKVTVKAGETTADVKIKLQEAKPKK
jgi:uncharacterized GH25 family protein